MTQTTRLNRYDRELTVRELLNVLSNIPRFVVMPIQDRAKMINMYHGKFPSEIFDAIKILKDHGYGAVGSGAANFRVAMEVEDHVYSALIKTDELPFEGEEPIPPLRLSTLLAQDPNILKLVRGVGWRAQAMPLNLEYMQQYLTASEIDSFVNWMIDTAKLRDELRSATRTMSDIFTMAKTAGQIKRMVPEMLQYLPAGLREAYDAQKRASQMPFEWTPYDKNKVEAMITTISKGHLLANMAKPGRESVNLQNMDSLMWGAVGEWGTPDA